MGSMNNNWLGFSLSPHEQDHSQNLGFNSSDEISATQVSGDQCFDLTSDSTIPSLNLPPTPFGILEAFNRNTTQSQDWNMKDMGMNSYSCSSQNQETPKLENFLGVGGHSFTDEHKNLCNNPITNTTHAANNNNSYNIYQEAAAHTGNNSTTMGLSMIKNWLRNNPAPPHAADNKVGGEAAPPQGAVAAGGQTLSLSMSTGSQSSDNSKLQQCNGTSTAVDSQSSGGAIESVPRKSIDTFGQRTSIYRGVTRHRWTGRYEAHLWDNSCRREGQTRKGRQVYLGGYDKEEKAARAYDLAALKYWGSTTTTNFPTSNYEKEMEDMKNMTRQEYVASLRRKSSGFSRGASIYRGVTRHHQHGRWQARIGRVAGNKDLYLGTFSTQEEAAEAYDIAAIKFRGLNAVTNFEISRYDVKCILESATLPIGGAAKRLKDAENAENLALEMHRAAATEAAAGNNLNLHLTDHHGYGISSSHCWPTIAFQQPQPLTNIYSPYQRSLWCKQEQQDPDIGAGAFNHDINHLQLGSCSTAQNNYLLHNLMGLDSSSSSSSNVYATNGMMPLVGAADDQNQVHGFVTGNDHHPQQQQQHEGIYGNMYNYHHQSQQSPSNGSGCTNWNIPTGVPTLAARANAMAVCHGASTFTVWNDT